MRKTLRFSRILVTLIAVGIVSGAAYAFTASNTVPVSYAGDGSGAISGYTASSITYTLNGTTPTNIDQVAFTLDHAATTVKARLVSGGTWYACSVSGGTSVTCNTTVGVQATAAAVNNLEVLAVQ
jgi:hypothetical protein